MMILSRFHRVLLLLLFIPSPVLLAEFATEQGASSQAASDTAAALRDRALRSNHSWQLVESLTTEVGPRLAGTPADHRAVRWAERQLRQAGLDDVWLEPVTFPVWQRHHERARVVAPFPQPLSITTLGYSGSTQGELQAPLLMVADLAALQAIAADQVKGHIVFVNQATARSRDGSGYANTVPLRYAGSILVKQKGGLGLLLRSLGTDSHRFPHTGAGMLADQPLPAAALAAPDADQLVRILARGDTVSVALDIRTSLQPGGHSWNVIGQLQGREAPEQLVLLGAHLDSWDLGTGALDDGAGVAITLATVAQIAALPQRPRRSIRIVLFANEEQGIWGAKAYTATHQARLADHIWASESDFGAGKVWRFDCASEALKALAGPLLEPLGIGLGGAPHSGGPDMRPLMDQGVPVFRLKQDGTDYFDYHHTADDTLDKIDAAALKQNVAAWSVVTYLAAEQP